MSRLPFAVLESDVTDVIYATWMVDVAKAAALAPPGARLWECEGKTPFTILSYRHGHFGPRLAGRARRLFPSPAQSNWRLYLAAPLPGGPAVPTVAFVHNVFSSGLYAIGTRLFSDALPSHLAARFELEVREQVASVRIEPGTGSALALALACRRSVPPALPPAFSTMFASWHDAVLRLASQEAAVAVVAATPRMALATISLPVDADTVEPLALNPAALHCPLLDQLGASADALCFRLPRLRFAALSESLL